MKNITQTQKKIIITGLIIAAAFLAFLLLIYSPSRNTVRRIKSELMDAEAQIKEIGAIIGEAESLDEGKKLLQARQRQINSKFPAKEEEALKMLSEFAQKLRIEVLSIKPQPKKVLVDENEKAVIVEGKAVRLVYVSIAMRCFYQELVKYIEKLRTDLPAFMIVEKIHIRKESFEVTEKSNITLDFNLFLLSA